MWRCAVRHGFRKRSQSRTKAPHARINDTNDRKVAYEKEERKTDESQWIKNV